MSTEHHLATLATRAPETILPQVMLETGLADGYVVREGPVGPIFVSFNPRGVSSITIGSDRPAFEETFEELFGRPAFPAKELPTRLARALDRALESGRLGSLQIDWDGMTEFQRAVLRKTAEILPGEVRPYSWIAKEIGKPKAVRAVGTALARNPVPIVLPCHRVVRNDGRLGNYYYGADVKRAVLTAEGLDVDLMEERITRNVRLVGSDTTRIFCHPTCRDARRITDRHLVEFRNETAARAAGYRPCRHCRPAAA